MRLEYTGLSDLSGSLVAVQGVSGVCPPQTMMHLAMPASIHFAASRMRSFSSASGVPSLFSFNPSSKMTS